MIIKFFNQDHFPIAAPASINNLKTLVNDRTHCSAAGPSPATPHATAPPCPRKNEPEEGVQQGLVGGVKGH